jgi:TRAP-type C4-dicarboxylate transport system permease small subunit
MNFNKFSNKKLIYNILILISCLFLIYISYDYFILNKDTNIFILTLPIIIGMILSYAIYIIVETLDDYNYDL